MARQIRQYSEATRRQAHALRRRGYTYTEICAKLGTVPKGTLAGWFKGIRLNSEQQARIRAKIVASGARGRPLARQVLQAKLETWKSSKRHAAQTFVKAIQIVPELAKLACALLYLAEGHKYPASKYLGFSNTDPTIIRLFLELFRSSFQVEESKFRCRVSRRHDQDYRVLKEYWSKVTQIPVERFFRSKADQRTRGKRTVKEEYRGVCVVYYCNVNFQYELQAIGEAFMELVEQRGIEPRASTMPSWRSAQLSYCPTTNGHRRDMQQKDSTPP